jgi:hypothetical protein
VAEPRLFIALRISHLEFISRKSSRVALTELIRGQARGEAPFFTTIALERGVEYTGQVVLPGGKPLAGIPYAFEHGPSRTSRSIPVIMDDHEGQTDDEGRIRRRMPKTHALALFVGPPQSARARFPFASYQHFWRTDSPLGQPHVWAPTDLGRIVLARGIRISGRLVDPADRPIAGQTIIAYPLKGRDRHSTTTEADGTFALGPLRSANYLIYGEVSHSSEQVTPAIQSAGTSWSQAVLRDGWYDPIATNYGALQPDAICLIGPDGKLIARGLQGTALEKAVAEALAGKLRR